MSSFKTTVTCPQCQERKLSGEYHKQFDATYRWCVCGFEDEVIGLAEEAESPYEEE